MFFFLSFFFVVAVLVVTMKVGRVLFHILRIFTMLPFVFVVAVNKLNIIEFSIRGWFQKQFVNVIGN